MKIALEIRMATKADGDALVQIGERLFDYPVKVNWTNEFLNDTRHHLALAFVKEQLVGMVSGVHYVHPDKAPQLFINELSVIETYRNKGIGRKLVRFLCEHAKTLGCSEAWVLTDTSNRAARSAYLGANGRDTEASLVCYEFPLD